MKTYYRVDSYKDGRRIPGERTFNTMQCAGQFALGKYPEQAAVVKVTESVVLDVNPKSDPPEINVAGFTLYRPDAEDETAEGDEE